MGTGMYKFWPLGEIKPVHEVLGEDHSDRYAYQDCYLFADWGAWCWGYAVRIVEGADASGPVFRVTGGLPAGEQIAASFINFIEIYLTNPYDVI